MLVKAIRYYNDNICYIIKHLKENYTYLVDPGDSKFIINYIKENNLKIDHLLITHEHHDHIGDLNYFLEETKIKKVYSGFGKELKIPKFYSKLYDIKDSKQDYSYIQFKNNINLDFENYHLNIINVPCHTRGSVYFNFINKNDIVEKEFNDKEALFNNIVLTGDTVFIGGCGRTFEGTHEEMLNNMNTAKNLNLNTRFLTGHDYMLNNLKFALSIDEKNTNFQKYWQISEKSKNILQGFSLEEMIKFNIFFMCDNKNYLEQFSLKTEVELFSKFRNLKDNY